MNYFEIIKLILTAFVPIVGWAFGWWVANNNFKKQRYDRVKEKILLEIKNLKDISISHYVKRDNSAVYIIQSFKELGNILIEEKFLKDDSNDQVSIAWLDFRVASTNKSDENILYKIESAEVQKILISYNYLHNVLLKHKYKYQ